MSSKGQESPESSYTYDFCDLTHPTEVLEALREYYTEGLFTDIALQCSTGEVFHCHKVALCSRSSYFRAMFTADMKERSHSVVRLPGVDVEVLTTLMDYVYTSKASITQWNVESLLEAADLLQFGAVKTACENFLVRLLDVDNCLGMLSFAQLHVCLSLEKEARRVLLCRFHEVVREEEFQELGVEKVRSLLQEENLAEVLKEAVLVEGVVRWLAHDTLARRGHFQELLHSAHLDLKEEYLRTALELHRECLETGAEDIHSLFVQALKTAFHINKSPPEHCRRSRRLTSRMFVIGGYHWHPLSEVQTWDPVTDQWQQGEDMPDHTRESYGVSLLGSNIYISGGYRTDTTEALDTVWVYSSDADKWTQGQPMLTARYYHCSVALHGCVYVIGGYRGGAPMGETEFYDPLKRKWIPVANMVQGVGNATACVLRNTIYVAGGHYGHKGSCTYDKIQTYRADVNEWSITTTCPHPEYGLCLVSLHPKLYLVGGQTTITDCYEPDRDEWRQLARTNERRMECGAVAMNESLYVTGGYSYSKGTYLQSVERYDPEQDTWEIVGNLPGAARSHGCVCVYGV
ncbi:kelch-like protein 23 [Salvelinus fontinalis]|uniref:kelch-like protein 23 n=1 Tax=Salvelinus fontinalis TaxID=8038 RepID=UPI002485D816|nr:kelch-like protein 23 [Salvelinus fontinalis]